MIATIIVMPILFSLGYLYQILIFQKFANKKTLLPFRSATKNNIPLNRDFFLNDLVYNTWYVCETRRLYPRKLKRNDFCSF